MKSVFLATLLVFIASHSFSQGMYGFDVGVGYGTAYKSRITPAADVYWLRMLTRHFYAGGEISFQRNSFTDNLNPPSGSINFGDIISIQQKSSYVFFTPKIDLGLGYRQYIHVHASFGPGIFAGGTQTTNQYEPFWATPQAFGKDTATYTTSNNIKNIIFRYGLGFSERIPTLKYWNIMLSEEYCYSPGAIKTSGPNLKANYIAFTVGIMHKYPLVAIED